MKNFFMLMLLSIILNISYSQNITIGYLEKIVKLNLYETDLSLSNLGFSYDRSDSNELCQFHLFGKDKFKNVENYSTIVKSYCTEIDKIQYTVFDKIIFNTLRKDALKSNYNRMETNADKNGLISTFIKKEKNFLIDFTQGKLKTESEIFTTYIIELYCRKDK